MGLFQSIVGGLQQAASNGRDATQLMLVFQENQSFARLAFQQFQRCVAERGMVLTEQLMRDAQGELSKYPKLTMGQFLDGYANKRMNDSL